MNNGTLKLLAFLLVFAGTVGGFSYQVASRPTIDHVEKMVTSAEKHVASMVNDKVAVQNAQIDSICVRLEKIEKGQDNMVKVQQETNRMLNRLVGELRASR